MRSKSRFWHSKSWLMVLQTISFFWGFGDIDVKSPDNRTSLILGPKDPLKKKEVNLLALFLKNLTKTGKPKGQKVSFEGPTEQLGSGVAPLFGSQVLVSMRLTQPAAPGFVMSPRPTIPTKTTRTTNDDKVSCKA